MKKALLFAPMGSVHRRFNKVNIDVLLKGGYEVHLLANFENNEGAESKNVEFSKECEKRGIIIHSLPFYRHSLFKNIKLVKEIKKIISVESFDIIHAHTETGGLLLRLSLSGVPTSCKLLYTPHGMSFYKGSSIKSQVLYKPIERWICKKMDCNLSMNSEEKFWIDKWNPKSSYFVHGVGLDFNRFNDVIKNKEYLLKEFNIPSASYAFVSVGELNENKNHKLIIDAISTLKNKETIYYILCGVGPLKDYLEEYAKKQRVNLILAGFRNDIPQIVSNCDIFLFPSLHEGLPVSLMEAMACGTPVIASQIRGNVDLIDNGVNGFTIKGNNYYEYSNRIELLLNDIKKRNSFIAISLDRINNYSTETLKEELKEIYGK